MSVEILIVKLKGPFLFFFFSLSLSLSLFKSNCSAPQLLLMNTNSIKYKAILILRIYLLKHIHYYCGERQDNWQFIKQYEFNSQISKTLLSCVEVWIQKLRYIWNIWQPKCGFVDFLGRMATHSSKEWVWKCWLKLKGLTSWFHRAYNCNCQANQSIMLVVGIKLTHYIWTLMVSCCNVMWIY